jgi:uncharacterized protein YkwD
VFRKKHVLVLFATVFASFLLIPAASAAHTSGSAASLLRAVNATRASFGLRPLRLDAHLRTAAQAHTMDMLHHGYFAHGDFHGRMVAFHVHGPAAGEDLAWGSGSYGEAQMIVRAWLASPEHRANLLRPGFSRIGIGVARGTFLGYGGATVVTADFAGR